MNGGSLRPPGTPTTRVASRKTDLIDTPLAWLRRAHYRASLNLSRYIRKSDLTPPQLATLLKLQEIGETSQNELGRLVDPTNCREIYLGTVSVFCTI